MNFIHILENYFCLLKIAPKIQGIFQICFYPNSYKRPNWITPFMKSPIMALLLIFPSPSGLCQSFIHEECFVMTNHNLIRFLETKIFNTNANIYKNVNHRKTRSQSVSGMPLVGQKIDTLHQNKTLDYHLMPVNDANTIHGIQNGCAMRRGPYFLILFCPRHPWFWIGGGILFSWKLVNFQLLNPIPWTNNQLRLLSVFAHVPLLCVTCAPCKVVFISTFCTWRFHLPPWSRLLS